MDNINIADLGGDSEGGPSEDSPINIVHPEYEDNPAFFQELPPAPVEMSFYRWQEILVERMLQPPPINEGTQQQEQPAQDILRPLRDVFGQAFEGGWKMEGKGNNWENNHEISSSAMILPPPLEFLASPKSGTPKRPLKIIASEMPQQQQQQSCATTTASPSSRNRTSNASSPNPMNNITEQDEKEKERRLSKAKTKRSPKNCDSVQEENERIRALQLADQEVEEHHGILDLKGGKKSFLLSDFVANLQPADLEIEVFAGSAGAFFGGGTARERRDSSGSASMNMTRRTKRMASLPSSSTTAATTTPNININNNRNISSSRSAMNARGKQLNVNTANSTSTLNALISPINNNNSSSPFNSKTIVPPFRRRTTRTSSITDSITNTSNHPVAHSPPFSVSSSAPTLQSPLSHDESFNKLKKKLKDDNSSSATPSLNSSPRTYGVHLPAISL